MGDGENNIPLGLSLITHETNTNMYTNLYLFRWILKNSWTSSIGFPKHTHFNMTSSNTRNKRLWIHRFLAKVSGDIVVFYMFCGQKAAYFLIIMVPYHLKLLCQWQNILQSFKHYRMFIIVVTRRSSRPEVFYEKRCF